MSDYYPKCAPDVQCPHCNPQSKPNEQSSLAPARGSAVRELACELAKHIEAAEDNCSYPQMNTRELETAIEEFFRARELAQPNEKS
jgi:hypothetical protein